MMSRDMLDIKSLFAQQVHGGIYCKTFALDPIILTATIIGIAKNPKLLLIYPGKTALQGVLLHFHTRRGPLFYPRLKSSQDFKLKLP